MASTARLAYQRGVAKAVVLQTRAVAVAREGGKDEAQILYHAALAFHVSAWQSYVTALVEEFFNITRDPSLSRYHVMHSLSEQKAKLALKRFNTPNWENTRNLLALETGFDPISSWIWPARSWGVKHVQDHLNQILQVRHSFAHGYPLPSFVWTRSSTGCVRITAAVMADTTHFFANLVRRSDQGMNTHIQAGFGIDAKWY